MIETQLADRRYRISLWCLIAAISCAVASLLSCYLVLSALPQETGWEGLGALIRTVLWSFAGSIAAACIGLVSLGFGIACARQRKRVLIWVVPLWLAAAFGVIAGVVHLTLLADENIRFIPGGKRDDLSNLLAVWLGSINLLYLAYWIASKVWKMRFRFFPLWSVPLWATALAGGCYWFV